VNDANKASALPLPEAMAGNFQEAARWFSQMWGAAADPAGAARGAGGPIPSMMLPTMDVKELDKRIADMRSVENWLELNLALLRATIQGMEMQRSTLAAWQGMGAAAAGAAAAGGAHSAGAATGGAGKDNPGFQPAVWWNALQQQFAQMAASAAAQDAAAAGKPSASAPAGEKPAAGKPKA
jgi:hypothetical protein